VTALQRRRTSYLAQAMGTDVELYEATVDQPRPTPHPDLVEFGLPETLLTGIHELLQQILWWSSATAPKGSKKPKIKRLPVPITAKHRYDRAQAQRAYDDVMSLIRFEDPPGR